MNDKVLDEAIKMSCKQFGVLDQGFLCQSVSALGLRSPVGVHRETPMREVLELLKKEKIGCVVVVSSDGKLVGLFSERDLVMKVPLMAGGNAWEKESVETFMTKDVVFENPEATIAYALNLMSNGGFRHLPIVDSAGVPVGIVSVKNIVDRIVQLMLEDLEKFGEI
jgi:CBS domain-containing protein